MILNRIARAVTNQNWALLTLELFVVVVGIFLGLQADDWNEARKNRHQQDIYLEKISQDLIIMRDELQERADRHEEAVLRMANALVALENCDDSEQARSDIAFAFERYQVSPGISFLDATYNEMVASGALARIRDYRLKQEIAYTFASLGVVNSRLRNFRISIPIVDGIVWKYVSYSRNPVTGRPTASFLVGEICENIEIRNAVVEMIDIQDDSLATVRHGLDSVNQLIELLSTAD